MPNDGAQYTISATPLGLDTIVRLSLAAAEMRCNKIIRRAPAGIPAGSLLAITAITKPAQSGNARTMIKNWWLASQLPVAPREAELTLNSTMIREIASDGRLDTVILHEMMHCLGFGFAWPKRNLLQFPAAGGALFMGQNALREYKTLLERAGKSADVLGVPVESEGAVGQNWLHWSDRVFGKELMTTAQNPGDPGPISAMTIASLKDLGYGVDPNQADDYWLP